LRNHLRTIGLEVELRLGFRGIEFRQIISRSGNIVPASVLEIDHGSITVIDRDHPADDADKALQLGPIRLHGNKMIRPLALHFVVQSLLSCIHRLSNRIRLEQASALILKNCSEIGPLYLRSVFASFDSWPVRECWDRTGSRNSTPLNLNQ